MTLEELVREALRVREGRPPLDDYGHPELYRPARPLHLVHDQGEWRVHESGWDDPPRSLAAGEEVVGRGDDLATALRQYIAAAGS